MRLFTGIDLSDGVRKNLDRLIASLRPTARLRWSVARNLHITTKFIGEWPSSRLEELTGALRALPHRPAVSISVRGLGWFPNARAPRVFWAGIEADKGLAELAHDTEQLTSRMGVPEERRAFSPHLTLARLQPPFRLDELHRALEALPSTEFGEFVADRFFLCLSERGPAGSVYTKLAEFPLEA